MYETKKIREIAERKSDEIAQIQHSIFDLAEYGYEVQKSASYLEALLEKEGFQVERGIGDIETAFVGTYGSGNPVIGILAEFDALPNLSQKAGETKQCPIEGKKYGHACGLMNVGVNYLREHIISTARVHYAYLDAGGEAPNIVQDHASLLYFIRAPM